MNKAMILLMTIGTVLLTGNATAADWKAKLQNGANNIFANEVKMKWYCNGRKQDADLFPYLKTKTRKLSYSKCRSGNQLSVKFFIGKIPTGIIFRNNEFENGFVGNESFVYHETKHCFEVSNQVVSGQPMIRVKDC